jgi:predicted ArsR family transcriptional regulator
MARKHNQENIDRLVELLREKPRTTGELGALLGFQEIYVRRLLGKLKAEGFSFEVATLPPTGRQGRPAKTYQLLDRGYPVRFTITRTANMGEEQ